MDAETYMKIEQLLMVASGGLFLMVVWVAMAIIKSKARYVYELHQLLMEKRNL